MKPKRHRGPNIPSQSHYTPNFVKPTTNHPLLGFMKLGVGLDGLLYFVIMSATFSPFQHVFSRFRSNNYAAKRLRNTFAQKMRQSTYYQDQPPS